MRDLEILFCVNEMPTCLTGGSCRLYIIALDSTSKHEGEACQ